MLKRVAAALPAAWQHELRRRHFAREIRGGRFYTDEKEYALLDTLLRSGDWALDIGANVGHYTLRLSQLVGPGGRVIAMEPVPDTFALLAANARLFPHANVTLVNAAASDRVALARMDLPRFADGLPNYYQARLSGDPGGLAVMTLPVDALALPRVALVKMDVEGHELAALAGMRGLLERDHPVMIVETGPGEAMALIESMGYACERLPGSSNVLCRPLAAARRSSAPV
ncbi:MAG: FkbM family methyltransferase [Burkholderiales bacterium]|nr:FkbM family methyltransferase [Burkholderiales bacterium]